MPIKTTDKRDLPNVFAIVPAAGRSRRMGRPKQLLEIDGVPMLLGVVRQLAASPSVAPRVDSTWKQRCQ